MLWCITFCCLFGGVLCFGLLKWLQWWRLQCEHVMMLWLDDDGREKNWRCSLGDEEEMIESWKKMAMEMKKKWLRRERKWEMQRKGKSGSTKGNRGEIMRIMFISKNLWSLTKEIKSLNCIGVKIFYLFNLKINSNRNVGFKEKRVERGKPLFRVSHPSPKSLLYTPLFIEGEMDLQFFYTRSMKELLTIIHELTLDHKIPLKIHIGAFKTICG